LFHKQEKMFSKACEYGIKAMIYLAQQGAEGRLVSLKEIAASIGSPEAFTAKILQQLRKQKLLHSVKGHSGGFQLGRPQAEICLSQIVAAIDGDQIFTGCGLGLASCSEHKPCPIHHQFKAVRDELKHMLESTNLAGVSAGLDIGTTFLKR
jgi:Rrf2 family protein